MDDYFLGIKVQEGFDIATNMYLREEGGRGCTFAVGV